MPTIQNTTRGQVVQIWGKAYIRGTDGVWRPLAIGEVVPQGAEILTEQNAIVMMTRGDVAVPKVAETKSAESTVDRAIGAVEKSEEPPAAGLQGGGSGDLQPGLRVDRIVELVTPASIATRLDASPVEFGRATQSDPRASDTNAPGLIVGSSSISSVEAGGSVGLGLRAPSGSGTLTITVTQLPAIGQVVTADGAPVAVGAVLTAEQLTGLIYLPPADYTAGTPVGDFGYSVSNGVESASGGTQIAVTPVNDAPLAIDGSNSGSEDILLDVSLVGTDIDGTIASVTVRTLPANGTLLLADSLAPVTLGQVLTPAQAAGLVFRPAANWNGSTAFTFTVTDNEGGVSAPATVRLTVTPANDPPVAINDTSSTVAQAPVTVAVLANDSDIDNDPLTVTAANVPAAQGAVVVNADGTLTFTAAAGVTGPVVISYSIGDGNGGTSAATLTVNVAAAPTVTVDAPALTNDRTPTLTGTSNLPPGSTVTLTVTDALGAVQTFTTTVRADGTYSVDVPAPLAEGPYTAVANVNGPGGTTGSATDNGEVDITPPAITVDAPALTNDSTPALTGTTDLPVGSTITLAVTGANGVTQLFTATVQTGGVFSVDVPAALVQGTFNVVATATDAAGNSASASDTGEIDTTPPVASLTIDPVTADNIVNAGEASGNITITGTVGGDVRVGDTVTLVVNGVNYTGLVLAGNTFAIAVPGAGVLADADRRIDGSVTTTDAAGNSATATAQRPYAVNSAPIAVNDTLSIGEDTASAGSDVTPGTAGQDSDADGDTLTVVGVVTGVQPSASGNVNTPLVGAWGTLLLDGFGAYTYAPSAAAQALDPGQTVTDTFTYTIEDGRGGTATATLTISVVGADDPTTISGVFIGAVTEDAVATASGTLTNNDPDVGTRPFVAQSNSAGAYGTFSIDSTGTWSYTLTNAAANVQALAQGQSVTETFIVATDDGTTASITVTVDGANDAPVVSSTAINAVEEGAAVGLGLSAPSDIDNASVLTITVTGLPTIGQVQLADGTPVANGATLTATQLSGLRYLPPADYSGASVGAFAYTVSDGITSVNGGTTITVGGVNDLPVAIDTSASGFEDTTTRIAVTPAGSDVDGTVTSYTLTSIPANGSLYAAATGGAPLAAGAVITGPVYFQPNPNFNGTVSFNYTATDNSGGVSANTATATIVVNPVNDAPTLTGVVATFNYSEGSTPTVVRAVIDGSVVLADIDSPDFNGGSVTVAIGNVVAAEDLLGVRNQGTGDGQIAVSGSTISYNPVGAAGSVVIGTLAGGSGTAPLVVTLNANASVAAVDALLQNITYGNASQLPTTTTRNLTITVVDGDGTANGGADTVSTNVNVNITRVNDAPLFTALNGGVVNTTEGAAAVLLDTNATVNDPELGSGFVGAINNMGGAVLTLARVGGANAQDQFSASGGTLALAAGNVVLGGNTVGTYDTTALANGTLQITFASGTTQADATSVLRQIRYVNTSDAPPASVAIGYTINDGNTGSQGTGGARTGTATVTVNIAAVNDPPVAANDSETTSENTPLAASVPPATDADGTIANYALVAGVGAGNGTLSFNSDGTFNFNPGSDFDALSVGATRDVSFTYTATDNSGAVSNIATVTITVTGANDAPTGADATYTIAEDGSRAFVGADFGFADVDVGDTLARVRIDSLPAAGALTLNGVAVAVSQLIDAADLPDLVFTPAANANGVNYANFTFSVQDSGGLFDAAPNTITLDVTAANDPPIAVVTPASGDEDTPIAVSLTGADLDGTIASVRVTALPANGTLFLADGITPVVANAALTPAQAASLVFVPAANFNGSVSVTFTVTDNSGATSAPAATPITVAPVVDPVISIDDVSVNEAAGTMTFTVSLSEPTTAAVSVNYATSNGMATAGSDYTAGSGTLNFAAGVTSQTITVSIAEDLTAEGNETFNVTLSAPVNATIGDGVGVGTIIDNDGAPTLTVSSPTVGEAGGFAVFTLALSNPSATATTFSLALADGSAGSADYGTTLEVSTDGGTSWISATSATFAAGATSVLVRTPVANDALDETNETFTLTATRTAGTTANSSATGTATITDDDATPSLSIGDVTVDEAAGTMSFIVTLSAASGQAVSVDYATSDASATAGADYTAASGTLNFAAGVTSQTVTVAIANDTVFESSETLNVTLTGATNATIADGVGVGTISDNDAAPTIASVSSPTVTEGSDLVYAVTLSNASSSATTFAYTLGGGSAAAADHGTPTFSNGVTLSAGVLTVPAGVTAFSITLPTTPDTLDEIDETVPVTVGGVSGTGTITDDDATPSLSINDVTVNEAAGTATFTVTLSAASGQTVTVGYNSSNGSATTGSDYTALVPGTLTFAPGVVTQTITVAITNDTVFESAEDFNVNLVSPTNATIADGTGVGTITDNDAAPTIASVSAATAVEATSLAHTVTLSNPSSSATTFSLSLTDGTATGGGVDYTSTLTNAAFSNGVTISGSTITVPAGVTSFTVTMPTSSDTIDEANETYTLAVGAASGTGTINDDDAAPTVSSVTAATQVEGVNLVHTVTLSNASSSVTTFAYTLGGGSATGSGSGTDYTTPPTFSNGVTLSGGILSVPAGVTSFTVSVPSTQDTIDEGASETYNLSVGGVAAVGTITDDDNAPTISSVSSPTVSEGTNLVYAVTLSNASSSATTFAYSLGGGSAVAADYGTPTFSNGVTLSGGILTVPADVTSFSITLPTTQDTLDEIDETVPVTVGGVTGAGTITDDDATPSLSINDVTVNEAAGTATFTVTLSAASGQTVTVGYNSSNGSATAGSDYTALVPGTLTFAPGVVSQTVTVNITNDTVFEPSEDFNVNLTAPTNATIADGSGLGTITDNDAAPTISSVSSPTVTEGSDLVYTVNLSNASSTATTFAYTLGGGTAAAADFGTPTFSNGVTLSGGILTVPAGVTNFSITLPTTQDALDEANETVPVTVGGISGTGTITDDDATPSLSISGAVAINEAAGTATYTVTLSAPSGQSVSVAYGTTAGTATAGADYTTSSGTLTFAPGVVSQTFTVPILNDGTYEGSESFTVNLTSPANATIATGSVTSNITDDGTGSGGADNDTPSLSVSSPTVAESGGFAVFTVSLSNASAQATTVSLSTASGTATSGADFSSALEVSTDGGTTWTAAATATIAAGATSVLVRAPITSDTLDEANETFTLTATRTAGTTSNAGATGTATITDDDNAPTIASVSAASAVEVTSLIHTVTLSNGSASATTFSLSLSDGTATGGGVDYTSTLTNAAFSNGVTIAGGVITVPAGVTSFTVTVPTASDTIDEADETYTLAVGAASGVGTINDDDAAPTVSSVTAATQVEGVTLVHTVTLSNASSSVTTFAYTLGGGSATGGGTDYTTPPTFSNGVTLSGGILSVPAGVTSFTVSVPSSLDTIDEGASETYNLSVGGVAAVGTITDDDNAPTISSVSSPTVAEGTNLVYAVTLSNASSAATTFAYSLGGGSAVAADYGTPTFSNGVTLSGGVLTVPAGVTNFSITLPTTQDTADEIDETVPVTIGGVTGTGTITDDDATPSLSINDVTVNEVVGTATFTVTLSAASGQTVSVGYNSSNGSATAGSDYTALVPGTLTFAPGVVSQTVTVNITNDTVFEPAEDFNVNLTAPTNATIADGSGLGTITDNDAAPTVSSVSAATAVEATSLVHTVTLSNASASATTFSLSLTDVTATGGGVDYTSTLTNASFSNGVTIAGGVITVPAGVTSFTVTVPTSSDTIDEANETYTLAVGAASGAGTINDDDAAPTVSSVTAATQVEGVTLVHTVTLSNASSSVTTFAYTLGGGSATGGGTDYTTPPTFSNGVTLSGGVLSVPAGVTSFTVSVPTSLDTIDEGASETYDLAVGGVAAVGTITDDDNAPTISSVSSPSVAEGSNLVYAVTLSNASSSTVTFPFTLGGGTASATDYTSATFSNGITLSGGVLTIPAGVTNFSITLPTVQDTIFEANETVPVSVGGVTGTGTITNDDATPVVSFVSAATAAEATSLVHTVTLSNASASATTFSLSLTDGSATGGGVDYSSTLTNAAFSNGVTISGGVITVPAGVTSFTVTVPSTGDTIDEANETYTLAVGSASGIGTINDDDNAPTVSSVSAATQVEGTTLVHTVTLSNASSSVTTFAYTLGSGSATGGGTDYTTPPTFSNGVTLSGGVLSVPAGVTSFTVSVPSTLDTIDEGASETYNLSVGGVAAVGTITDDDNAPTISSVSSPTVSEGTNLVYAVTLSNASSSATTFAYSLGGGSAGATDYGTPTFSNGVTLSGGILTVPAGVTAFSITLTTTQDTLDEINETVPVTVGGVTGTGTINDDDATPSLSINDVTVNESGTTMTFTVSLSAASGQLVSVNYATGNGTALAGSDYTAGSGTVTFAPGTTSQTITVTLNNDTINEPAETLYVNLSAPNNATIADGLGIGTILDNDAAPTVAAVSAASVTEGGNLVHTVTLGNASSTPTNFAYTLGGASASAGTDYNATPTFSNGVTLSGGVLTVPAGVTSFTVTVASLGDVIAEANETYTLGVGGVTAVGTINDDDPRPTLSVNDVTVFENQNFAVFTVSLSAPSSSNTLVNLALINGTATGAGNDYGAAGATNIQVSTDNGVNWTSATSVTIAANTTSVLVRTPIINNSPNTEANETFTLRATHSGGNTLNTSDDGVGTIIEPNISIDNPTVTEGTGAGTTTATFTVTLSNALPAGGALVPLVLSGTASVADYGSITVSGGGVTLVGGVLNIPQGTTSFTINVPVTRDALDEQNETLLVSVGGATGTLTINDDDNTPTLAINDVTVNEAAGTATFTVTLSAASGQTVTVNYGSVNQSALSGSDFSAVSGTLTFAPGVTTQTITVPILQDNIYEGSETLRINLSAPVNATIADGTGIGTIRDDGTGAGGTDNDTPTLAVSSITVSDQSAGFATFVVSLSNPSASATSVSLALANGSGVGNASGSGVDYGASGATNLQVSTNNGATWVNATSATIPANATYVLVRTPVIADSLVEPSETFTLTATRTAGTTTNASAVGTATITDADNAPVANNDAPTTLLQEDTPAQTVLAGNAILGGSGSFADADPNNDTLAIVGAIAGTGVVSGAVALGSPLTVSGTFGNLVLQADGSYTYTLDNARIQTQNMLGGQIYTDTFTYRITDGNGGYDTATITVSARGTLDLTAITPQPVAIPADGLQGEYYGYNDTTVAGNRVHADDGSATALGTGTNIESVEDVTAIINGRNATMGGPGDIVGSNVAGATNAADVTFNVRTLNYGTTPVVNSSLGSNAATAAGNLLPPQDNNNNSTTTALANFLDQDAATARVQTGTPTGGAVGTQTGLGRTTDAIVRMTGFVYLERGNYDFRVTGDDGFRLRVGGETLIEFDGNQPPTTRQYFNVEVSDLISGLTSIELLYWEQGGNANLQFEFRPSDSTAWVPFSLDSIAFFSAASAPTLTDTRIQDIVETDVNQQYELRTGSVLDGDGATNTLTGAEGRDYIQGFNGDDILNGNGAADFLDGGIGNDALNGGDGNDILVGGAGADAMTGGMGDDIYRIDNAGDVVTETAGAGQGTDTIEIEATYNVGTYTLAANIENALLYGGLANNVTGNAANNRITGNDGSNVLVGGVGNDRLLGGRGNDTLTGGADKDIFEWNLADRSATPGAPAIDNLTDFTYGGSTTSSTVPSGDLLSQRTDSLDLRDLLVGESSTSLVTGGTPVIGNLQNYLDISFVGGNTEIRISSTGGFSGGTYAAGQEDQRIVLSGVNLFTATGTSTEADLLQRLLANGTLVVD